MPYVMKTKPLAGIPDDALMPMAYTLDGHYIGTEEWAKQFDERGIAPEPRDPRHDVCSIGFCEREQKWYGWSHRAMHGFTVGDSVKRGDCAYAPTDPADFLDDCVRFWSNDEHHAKTWGSLTTNEDGVMGVQVSWLYSDDVPNADLRGTEGGAFMHYPDTWGRGEWTAQTLEDAKQMACDYAEGVD